MNYEFDVQTLTPQPSMIQRRTVELAKVSGALAQMLPGVWQFLQQKGVQPAGAPFAIYHPESETRVTVEAGLPLGNPTPSEGDFYELTIPGGESLVTVHQGSYETLGDAHQAMKSWCEKQNREAAGPIREIYETDPSTVPDPKDWRTRLICPLKPAS